MNLTVEEKKLQRIIRRAVSEALDEKMLMLKFDLIPYVGDKEMAEIEKMFGTPVRLKNQKFQRIEL